MKSYIYILALLFMLVFSMLAVSAEPVESEQLYSKKWEPLYNECMAKFNALFSSTMVTINNSDMTEQEEVELQEFTDKFTNYSVATCSCVTEKSDAAFSNGGLEISAYEINNLARSFRYETLIADPNIRLVFGTAASQCTFEF